MTRADVEQRVRDLNHRDVRAGWALIAMGVPFAVLGILFLSGALFVVLWILPLDLLPGVSFLIALGLVLVAVAIDTWRHPSEHWHKAEYYLAGGGISGPEIGSWYTEHELKGAAFSGMPLMTNMGDPRNLATRGQVIANGCANIVLSGPRSIRKGIEELRLAKARGRPQTINAALQLVNWFEEKGEMLEVDVVNQLASQPSLGPGYALANELGLLARTNSPEGKRVRLRS